MLCIEYIGNIGRELSFIGFIEQKELRLEEFVLFDTDAAILVLLHTISVVRVASG